MAQLVGGFAAADRAGRLVLRTFAEKPCAALTAAARSEAAVSDFACHYAALSIETDDGSFAAGRSQDTGLTMRISNMTLAERACPPHGSRSPTTCLRRCKGWTTSRPP